MEPSVLESLWGRNYVAARGEAVDCNAISTVHRSLNAITAQLKNYPCWVHTIEFKSIKTTTNQLHGTESFLRSLQVLSYSRNSPYFTKPKGSSPHSQQPITCSCPQPDRSSPYPLPTSRRSILILSSHLSLELPRGLLPSGFSTKTLYAPVLSSIRATFLTHLRLLDLIVWMIFDEEYRA